jgi:hypothetical protein
LELLGFLLHEDLLLELLLLLNLNLLLHEQLLQGFLGKTHGNAELLGLLAVIALVLLHILELPISHHVLIRILKVMHLHLLLLLLHHNGLHGAANSSLRVASFVLNFGGWSREVRPSNDTMQVVSFLIEHFILKIVADYVQLHSVLEL